MKAFPLTSHGHSIYRGHAPEMKRFTKRYANKKRRQALKKLYLTMHPFSFRITDESESVTKSFRTGRGCQ